MSKKVFVKKDMDLKDGFILDNFDKVYLTSLIDKIDEGNLIILSVKKSYIIIQKFTEHYEMDVITNDGEPKWENWKHDDYSLRITLSAIYQTPEINSTKFYEYKYNGQYTQEVYMKIIDKLLKKIKLEDK